MKKTMILLATALIMAFAAQAQETNASRHERGHGRDMDPKKAVEMRMDKLEKALSLTADQREAITEIYMQQAREMKAKMDARKNEGKIGKPDKAEREARHEQMFKRQQETDAKVEALLNAEQKARFAELKQHRHKDRGMHKKMNGGANGKDSDCCDKDNQKKSQGCGSCDHDKKAEAVK